MRLQIAHLVCALFALVWVTHAWTKEDHEIFRLRDELEAAEGPETSFYDFVGVKAGASVDEINKAFRKKSRAIHPDKAKHNFIASKSTRPPKKPGEKRAPGVHVSKGPTQREIDRFLKQATARYQRLGVIAGVLKGPQRERYDHFLRHGFPAWRGTGYYYSRYRPGLGTVLFGLFLAGGGAAHYGALKISYNSQRAFMDKYIRSARKQAWGDESGIRGIPGLDGPVEASTPTPPEDADAMVGLNRRQKREMERQNRKEKSKPTPKTTGQGRVVGTGAAVEYGSSQTPLGAKKRVMAENGKVLIVDSVGNVFLEEEDEDGNVGEYLLDIDDIHKPTMYDTALFRLPVYLYRKAFDPFLKSTKPVQDSMIPEDEKMQQPDVIPDEPRISRSAHVATAAAAAAQERDSMSASQISLGDFEIVDSTGIENDAKGQGGAKKRNKKVKK